jgi:hypothetical protein
MLSMLRIHVLVVLPLLSASCLAEELVVLPSENTNQEPRQMLSAWLKQQAYAAREQRQVAFEQVKTPGEIKAWQEQLHAVFVGELGGFPERTPLNPKLVGALSSWMDVVRYPAAPGQLVNAVHGVLRSYDLADLLRLLPPDRVKVEEPPDLRRLAMREKRE